MAEQFNLQREDIQVPKYIMEQIESGEYDDYNKMVWKFYWVRLRLLVILVFEGWLLFHLYGWVFKEGFHLGGFLGVTAAALLGVGLSIEIHWPFPARPSFASLPRRERINEYKSKYINEEIRRKKREFDATQKKNQDVKYDGIRRNIEALFPKMAYILHFRNKIHILNYRTWLSLGIYGLFEYLQEVFNDYGISVENHRPYYLLRSKEGELLCGLYFSYATTPPGNAILEKIKRMKHIHLTTEVYLITVENCTEKVRTKLAEENIEWLNLEDFVSSIYHIIKIDKIVSHFLGVGYLCEGKIGLSELYDLFKIYSEVKIESQFEDATKNFDKELILRSRKSKNRYLQYLKRKFATNPFQDGDSFDTTVKKFQNICKLPLSIELPFYNYDEFEKMNSSEPYDYRSPNPYRKQKRESVIL